MISKIIMAANRESKYLKSKYYYNDDYYNDDDDYERSDSLSDEEYDSDGYPIKYHRRPPAKRAERSTLFLNNLRIIDNGDVKPLSFRERRDAKWIVVKTLLVGYYKNADCILGQLPFDILKNVIKNVERLTDRNYRDYIKERENYLEHLKNRPEGFASTYHTGGIILCIPNR